MLYESAVVKISDKDFHRLSGFIFNHCGINLPAPKKVLVESRLQKRLSSLNMSSFSSYCNYVMGEEGKQELVHLIDSVATNKTDFFREPAHFEFLEKEMLPLLAERSKNRLFKAWSSACSTGEEPYTLGMVLAEATTRYAGFDFRIIGSDISTKVLKKAITGVYDEKVITTIPLNLRKKYLLRSRDRDYPTVRIVPQIRAKVQFKRMNLMDQVLEIEPDLDAVFCRNVLIYFNRATQEQVLRKLLSKLKLGGYLFIGHSESIHHMNLPVRQIKTTVFQRV